MKKYPFFHTIIVFISLLFWQCGNDDEDNPADNVPSISDFSPTEGTVGTSVTVNGAGFSGSLSENIVRFNGVPATVTAASANSLTAIVPPTAATGSITVETDGQTATSSEDFTVISEALTITDFTPVAGAEGTAVIIRGTNFSTSPGENTVQFNFTPAAVTVATSTSLTVIVPTGATTGPISIEVDDRKTTSTTDFIVAPTLADFTPTSGVVGTIVTINGTNFSSDTNENIVKFNNVSATVSTASVTNLTVTVPPEAKTGQITIQVGDLMVGSTSDFTVLENVWVEKADLQGVSRMEAVSFTIGDKGYVGTGFSGGGFLEDFWEFDPAANSWTRKADMEGIKRRIGVGFGAGGKGYVSTGIGDDGGFLADLWEYDPATDEWTEKAEFEGEARWGAVAFSINGKGYIGTGFNGAYLSDLWEYDPALNKWTQKAPLKGAGRWGAVGFSIGNKGYIGTGYDEEGNQLADFWEYDPVTDSWTEKKALEGVARDGAVGFSIGTKGYIGLGSIGPVVGDYAQDLWEYDPTTDEWTEKATYGGDDRYGSVSFSIGDKGYVGAGADAARIFRDFWEYTPE